MVNGSIKLYMPMYYIQTSNYIQILTYKTYNIQHNCNLTLNRNNIKCETNDAFKN